MIQKLNSISLKYNEVPLQKGYTVDTAYTLTSFKGMSNASQYKSSFDYLAAKLIDGNKKKWGLDGKLLSASKIKEALEQISQSNKLFIPYTETVSSKINWRNYIPQDVRDYCIDKINKARAARLDEWRMFLETPESVAGSDNFSKLVNDVKNDLALKFVIWNSINSELTSSNRHIPVPFDMTALDETVQYFKKIQAKFRAVSCAAISFLDMYTHRLRDDLLMKKGLAKNQELWIRIPSAKRDPKNLECNIKDLEILSYRNWCTRSSVDKAADALADGDFYLYLRRDNRQIWQSLLGVASSKGKIDQIQGRDNNNFIPLTEIDNIKSFLDENNLKCVSGVHEEGPKAFQQILIAQNLNKIIPSTNKTLADAIKQKDSLSIFTALGNKPQFTSEGKYEIGTYKSQFLLREKGGIVVPYAYMGIDEDVLLKNVEKINGDLILHNLRNKLFNSSITVFPPNLREVTGSVVCNKEQYEKFKDDIIRVVRDENLIKISNI